MQIHPYVNAAWLVTSALYQASCLASLFLSSSHEHTSAGDFDSDQDGQRRRVTGRKAERIFGLRYGCRDPSQETEEY